MASSLEKDARAFGAALALAIEPLRGFLEQVAALRRHALSPRHARAKTQWWMFVATRSGVETSMRHCMMGAGLALAAVGISATPVLAWGQEGHAIVAEIAQRHLAPQARIRIGRILGPGVSLASIATWADDVRNARPNTYNWHFVDMHRNDDHFDEKRDCPLDPKRGDCIIKAIDRNRQQLSSPRTSTANKREALKFLVHFIGDLHQPLHTVLENAGGTLVSVRFFKNPTKEKVATKLHFVWDSGLIQRCVWNWSAYLVHLQNEWLATKPLKDSARGSVIVWAEEAHHAAQLPLFSVDENADLGDDYVKAALPILDRQLALAGLRLARVLNEEFGAVARPYRPIGPESRPTASVDGWFCKDL